MPVSLLPAGENTGSAGIFFFARARRLRESRALRAVAADQERFMLYRSTRARFWASALGAMTVAVLIVAPVALAAVLV